jgi:hypothetical protein
VKGNGGGIAIVGAPAGASAICILAGSSAFRCGEPGAFSVVRCRGNGGTYGLSALSTRDIAARSPPPSTGWALVTSDAMRPKSPADTAPPIETCSRRLGFTLAFQSTHARPQRRAMRLRWFLKTSNGPDEKMLTSRMTTGPTNPSVTSLRTTSEPIWKRGTAQFSTQRIAAAAAARKEK